MQRCIWGIFYIGTQEFQNFIIFAILSGLAVCPPIGKVIVWLVFQVIDGEYKGRLLWARLNLDNPNQLTTQIARSELSAICRAVGVMQPKDSLELHNLPILVTVKCKKRDDTGEITNEIKGYAKKEAATGQPQQAASSTPPWARR